MQYKYVRHFTMLSLRLAYNGSISQINHPSNNNRCYMKLMMLIDDADADAVRVCVCARVTLYIYIYIYK